MARHKTAKSTTLTKINPSVLKPKPVAVSQHAAQDGTHITKAVNPIRQPPVPLVDPLAFSLGLENFNEESTGDVINGEDISRGYYVAWVCAFNLLLYAETDRC